MDLPYLHALMFLMILGAIIAVETADLLSSIISVGAVGFLLSIAFLFLGAPDVAKTQIVVEILCLIILIRATLSRDLTAVSGEREFFGMVVSVVMIVMVLLLGIQVFSEFPTFGSPVMDRIPDAPSNTYLVTGLRSTGAPNIVSAILLDFRAFDALGQATVLFCAVLGALAILRRKPRREAAEKDEESDAA